MVKYWPLTQRVENSQSREYRKPKYRGSEATNLRKWTDCVPILWVSISSFVCVSQPAGASISW